MAEWVNTEVSGPGEFFMMQDNVQFFADWRNVVVNITPESAFGVLGHLEASGATRPGDASVIWGLGTSQIPAGAPGTEEIYDRMHTAGATQGRSWDSPFLLATQPDPNLPEGFHYETIGGKRIAVGGSDPMPSTPEGIAFAERQAMEEEDEGTTIWGVIKGGSRWLGMAIDAIPIFGGEWRNSFGNAISYVKEGTMTPQEAIAGMTQGLPIAGLASLAAWGMSDAEIDRAGEMVGMPFYQYLRAAVQGKPLNMGTGIWAQGEVAEDVQTQMAMYDDETHGEIIDVPEGDGLFGLYNKEPIRSGGLTEEDFERAKANTGGRVLVQGMGGVEYEAKNLGEWKTLRDTVGRAALLQDVSSTSAQQASLGMPFGSFDKPIYSEQIALRRFGTGDYFATSMGRNMASIFTKPGTRAFELLSGSGDIANQVLDIGVPLKGVKMLSAANKFTGLGGEAGQLAEGTSTLVRMVEGADAGRRAAVIADAQKGTINLDLGANALARYDDVALGGARTTLNTLRDRVKAVADETGNPIWDIDLLATRATTRPAARRIVERVATEAGIENPMEAVENLLSVQAREGTDLFNGVWGKANVSDDILNTARTRAEALNDLIVNGKGSVVADPTNGKQMVTFDADIGRAQQTITSINETVLSQAQARSVAANKYLGAVRAYQNRWAVPRMDPWVPAQQLADNIIEAAADPALKGVVSGRNILDGPKLNRWADEDVVEAATKTQQEIYNGLFKGNWMAQRRAINLLGDTEETSDAVMNASRVLRRAEPNTLLLETGAKVTPELGPGQLQQLLTGGGRASQLVDNLAAAGSHDEIHSILKPTVDRLGEVPPLLVDALVQADDPSAVVQAFVRYGAGQMILPPRMSLLGKAAKFGTFSTSLGVSAGGVAGGYQQYEQGGDVADIIGGAIGGAAAGAILGSGLAGTGAWMTGATSRNIKDVADAMDLVLAGTRATTSDFLRSNGVAMGVAQGGLSIPAQLGYAYQHSPLGRRIARSARTDMNPSDPVDFYYKLADYVRSLGMRMNDRVELWEKGVGAAKQTEKVITSRMTAEELATKQAELLVDGFKLGKTAALEDVFHDASQLAPNNPARAHDLLISFGQVADAILETKGMSAARIHMLTDAFRTGAQEFLGATQAMGVPSGYMQQMVIDEVMDIHSGARLDSEVWSGKLNLPAPDRVFRAMNQLDAVGRATQLFTGRGVLDQIKNNMKRATTDPETGELVNKGWTRLTPDLERNIGMRTARTVTTGLWSTVVLLGRPFSFASKILGEDQARMTAAGLNSVFSHPWNYLSAIAANYEFFRNAKIRPLGASFGRYGISARSDLGDIGWIDSEGNVIEDALDEMGSWGLAERTRHALSIYSKETAERRHKSVFGSRSWVAMGIDEPGGMEGLATEFRQLVDSPIIRHMANSTADNVVDETYTWLTGTVEGRAVAAEWAGQFKTDFQRDTFMKLENLKAFLHDQHARMHLKTGGDWVFAFPDGAVINSLQGVPLTDDVLQARGLVGLEPGYYITRKGDQELLDAIAQGSIDVTTELTDKAGRVLRDPATGEKLTTTQTQILRGDLNEAKFNQIRDLVRRKHDQYEKHATTKKYDPNTDHRFPPKIKGPKQEFTEEMGGAGIASVWDDGIDRMFQFFMGIPSRIFSRQPTLGGLFWERIGMLMPSMDDKMEDAFRRLAQKEGTLGRVDRIAAEFRANGPAARGTLRDVSTIDLNAKAYAIEQTKNFLFDLHRQRNFVDGIRVIFPFAGPFIEAMEAWGRVIRRNPYRTWRRGTQLVSGTWNTTGMGDDYDPGGFGWFWTDPETGEQMFKYPLGGSGALPGATRAVTGGDVNMTEIQGRARGLNVVFGPDDLTQGVNPEIAGFPLTAFDPGLSPLLSLAASPFMGEATGLSRAVFDFWFPYGQPESFAAAMLPYNLRKGYEAIQGALGNTSEGLTRQAVDQYARMMANGEIGPGREFNTDTLGGNDAAWEEAQNRASGAFLMEAIARTLLPTMMTPEVVAELEADPKLAGVIDVERMSTIDALGNWAYELSTPEGAKWWETQDGYMVSTEGDFEVVTAYMNEMLGLDMFSAELLSLPLVHRIHPVAYTDGGLDWMKTHEPIQDQWKASATLLMPNYAYNKQMEDNGEYSFAAADYAKTHGDAKVYTFDEQKEQSGSRLLKLAVEKINREANKRFGFDDEIEGDQQDIKDQFILDRTEEISGQFSAGDIKEGQRLKVFAELITWNRPDWDWDSQGLTDAEMATVNAVDWYLEMRDAAIARAREYGVNDLDNKGEGEDNQTLMRALRHDLRTVVAQQFDVAAQSGLDMGNFRYIFREFLEAELLEKEEEYDAFANLARMRRDEYGMEDLSLYLPPEEDEDFEEDAGTRVPLSDGGDVEMEVIPVG